MRGKGNGQDCYDALYERVFRRLERIWVKCDQMLGIGSSGRLYKGSRGFESHLMVLPSRYWLLPSGEPKAQEPETTMQDMIATARFEYELSVS